MPINPVSTWYADYILFELQKPSNHVSLLVSVTIKEEHIQERNKLLLRIARKKRNLFKSLETWSNINTSNIFSSKVLEDITQNVTKFTKELWSKYSKLINITKQFKEWWNKDCNRDLLIYKQSKK